MTTFWNGVLGMGSSRVRAPRLALEGKELLDAETIIKHAIATKPAFPA